MIYVVGFVAFCLIAGLMWLFFTWLWRQLEKRVYRPRGADAAIRRVWCDTFGQPYDKRPRVFFIKPDGTAGAYGWTDRYGRKVDGHAIFRANAANVGFPRDGSGLFSASALSYELARFVVYRNGSRQYDEPGGISREEFFAMDARGRRALREWEAGDANLMREGVP